MFIQRQLCVWTWRIFNPFSYQFFLMVYICLVNRNTTMLYVYDEIWSWFYLLVYTMNSEVKWRKMYQEAQQSPFLCLHIWMVFTLNYIWHKIIFWKIICITMVCFIFGLAHLVYLFIFFLFCIWLLLLFFLYRYIYEWWW